MICFAKKKRERISRKELDENVTVIFYNGNDPVIADVMLRACDKLSGQKIMERGNEK